MKTLKYFKLLLTVIVSCCLFYTSSSFALGKVGHKVVCQIAYDHLNNDTQQAVDNLLTFLPKKDQKLINKYHYRNANTPIEFIDTCSWADAIKKDKSFDKFKPWHYMSVARNETTVTSESCNENCITGAISFHKNQLSQPKSTLSQLHALMFLSHWIGDIHQPMHVGFSSDRGGNDTKVEYAQGKCSNMHWLWDECLLYPTSKIRDQKILSKTVYDSIGKRWEVSPIKQWQSSSHYQWATESLAIARTPSVMYCELNVNTYCLPLKQKNVSLPIVYQKEHQKILETRILQAAVRLTHTLNNILK